MSFRIIKKRKPALWLQTFPEQAIKSPAKPERRQRRPNPISKKRQTTSPEYKKEAKAYVAAAIRRGERCPVFAQFLNLPEPCKQMLRYPWNGKIRTEHLNEVHHKRGRNGPLLLDKRHWMPVSKWGHRVIHAFPKVARQFGWMCPPGQWNVPDRTPNQDSHEIPADARLQS